MKEFLDVNCPVDEFENAILKLGVVAACEWLGHSSNSEFTKDTLKYFEDKLDADTP